MNDNFYKSIIDEFPTGYAYHKIICNEQDIPCDYKFIEVNPAFEKFTGLKGIDIIGKQITQILPKIGETEIDWIKLYGEIAINGGSRELEEFSQGLQRWYRIKVYSPEKYYFITYIMDISKEMAQINISKNLESIVKETQLKYKTVVDYAYDWETWEDEKGKLQYVSPACERISGYTVDEFIANEALFASIILEEDQKIWVNHRHDICNNIGINSEQFRIKNKNGQVVWIEHTYRSIMDEKGGSLGYRANNRDISKRKSYEEILKENEMQFQRIIENLPFSISIIKLDGTILYANPKGLELFEHGPELIGTKTTPLLWVDAGKQNFWLKTIRDRGIVNDFDMQVQSKSGKIFWVIGSGQTILYQNQSCILSTQQDITERKIIEYALKTREEEYRLLFENAVESIVVIQNKEIMICNPMVQRLTGYSNEELTSMPFLNLVHSEDLESVSALLNQRLRGEGEGEKYKHVFRLVRKDQEIRWVETDGIRINWNGKEATLKFVIDITIRKQTEDALRMSEEKYRLLTEYASDVIWVLNLPKSKFTYISPSIFYLRGLTAEEAMNERLEESMTPESLVIIRDAIERNIDDFLQNPNEPDYYINEIQQPCENGDIIWVEVSMKYRYNSDGEIEIVGVSRNIEERKKSEREVLYLSYHDLLTGLYNRRFYEVELARLDKERNLPITLVMADVNGLKLTNDAFGHLVGDELLKTFATILKQEARGDDIISRTGGDEFVLLLPETDSLQAERIVKRIKSAIASERTDKTILSVSFGWATKTKANEEIEKIFIQAEDNMYRKKLFESTSMKSETIKLITKSLYEKNAIEQRHCDRVSKLCQEIGIALGLNSDIVEELGLLGLLHDIGKIGINEKVLNKPDKLDKIEWADIKRHPEIGYQILRSVNEFAHIAEYVLSHHERPNGKGYPRNLKDSEIPLQSKILSIAEAYDTMTHDYPYKTALSNLGAISELEINSNAQFDAEIAKIFVEKVLGLRWN